MINSMNISISSGSIVKVLVWVTLFTGLLYLSDVVIALLVAVVLASAIEAPVRFFMKRGIPRGLVVSGMFVALILIFGAIAFIFIPPLADDIARFIKTLPNILESVRVFGKDLGFKDAAAALQDLSRDISKGQILTTLKNALLGTGGFFATTGAVISGIINVVLTFVLAFYLALEDRGVQKFLRLVVPKGQEVYVEDLWSRAQHKISMWMQGQMLLSLLIALLVYVPMLVLGMPYATLLALFAFFGELVPVVGLTLATLPALLIAWVHGGLPMLGVVALIYFIISQLENHILYPKVMNKLVGVPSVIIIIAVVIGAKLAGLWGVILAVPLAAVVMELVSDFEKRKQNHVG